MTTTTWTTLIAVLGTLIAGFGTAVLKNRADRAARRDEQLHATRSSAVTAVRSLLEKLLDHYAAMWDLEAARVRGDQSEIDETLAASLNTRSAVTGPHFEAKAYVPALADVIDATVQAVYAMDSATDATRTAETVEARRVAARSAVRSLERQVLEYFGRTGVGLPT